jgi:hypothetical protein
MGVDTIITADISHVTTLQFCEIEDEVRYVLREIGFESMRPIDLSETFAGFCSVNPGTRFFSGMTGRGNWAADRRIIQAFRSKGCLTWYGNDHAEGTGEPVDEQMLFERDVHWHLDQIGRLRVSLSQSESDLLGFVDEYESRMTPLLIADVQRNLRGYTPPST